MRSITVAASPPAKPGRWSTAALALVLSVTLFGCAQLPKDVERPVSQAVTPTADSTLGRIVQERRASAGTRYESGFVLLSGAPAAYGSRLALVESAQKTLDLQYYAIHADASTARLLSAVRDAAQRGVRVRVLLDDFHTTGRNALVMALAFVPNIEMRMFNPLAGARASSLGRVAVSLTDADRIQQRMHNKMFVADNLMAVTGGRNLGDAYFGNAERGNFVDLDVLTAGPVVQDLSRSFDAYWNNERAYPVQSLVTQEELQELRDKARKEIESPNDRGATQGDTSAGPKPPDGEPRPANDEKPTPEQRAWAWDQKPLDLRTASFVWAPAVVLADKPGKIQADGNASTPGGSTRGTPAGAGTPGDLVVSKPRDGDFRSTERLEAAAQVAASGDTVVEGLLQLMGQARQELLVISPYFVPGEDMKKAFREARARGVRVRVLTNSLASNDAPVAHVGYARHREELLAMGLELYELRSEQAGLGSAFGASGENVTGASRSMLHSKAVVLDHQWLVVGSMNLDLRSQLQNTELALLIRSRELSDAASAQIESALRTAAWRVEKDAQGLIWRAPQGSQLSDTRTEPDSSASLRLLLRILGPLAPDEML